MVIKKLASFTGPESNFLGFNCVVDETIILWKLDFVLVNNIFNT